ncbi:MAG: sucB [Nocardioidaceae bacterium]|nr:sucB [Nocardioidaceae bacterium]
MATPVKLPALGESVTEGTVTRWLKQVGDSVEVDEALLEVSTDKVDTEIPSPVAGTLLEIKVDEDETVEVGAELAVVGDESESSGESAGSDESGADESDADESGADESDADEEAAASDEASGDEGSSDKAPSDSQNEAPSDEAPTDDDSSADKNTDEGEEKQVPEEPPKAGAEESSGEGTSVTLPELGESVTEGTVTRWLKQVGDSVEVDEALLEVSTDKVDTEIPSPVAGTLLEIKVEEDETVEVGAELAVVGSGEAGGGSGSGSADEAEQADAAEEKPEPEPEAKDEPDEGKGESAAAADEGEPPTAEPSGDEPSAKDTPDDQAKARGQQQDAESPEPASPGGGSYVTPLVRKLAAQHDVDLSGVEGTGVGGRIRKQDVLAAAEQAQQAPAEEPAADEKPAADKQAPAAAVEVSPLRGTTEKMTRLRKTIAKRMVESLQVSAQLTTVVEVDVTAIGRLRGRVKDQFLEREGVKLSFLPFFAKATIDCLKAHPRLNASIDTDAGEVTYHGSENLGVAVDTERGLLVPVIKDAGDLSIAGLSRKIADLASRTRDNKVSPDELSGGTFTLTNTGSRGALFDTPIINQPQVGILGTGSVVKRPVVIDDPDLGETIALRQMAYLALSYDHRIVDGADAARFLTAVKARLEEANFEAELGF